MDATDVTEIWPLVMADSMVGLAVLDREGRVVAVSPAMCVTVGRDHLIGQVFAEMAYPDDVEILRDAIDEGGGAGAPRAMVRFEHADGSLHWAQTCVVRVPPVPDRVPWAIVEILDVTAQRHDQVSRAAALADLQHQRNLAQAILDTVDIGLVLVDSVGTYERMNRRQADFIELAFPDGHLGRAGQLGWVFGEDGETRLGRDEMPSTRAQRGEEFDDYRIWIGADPATRRAVSVSGRNVLDHAGVFAGAALAYTDITAAVRVARSREDFFATVSHELRTPLASMLGHLELLLEESGGDEFGVSLTALHRNALRLRLLVSDLIESAQHRRGTFHLDRSRHDVSVVVREAVSAVEPLTLRAEVAVVVEASGPTWALADQHRLRQVVDNLLSNAVKYTPAGGRVQVRLTTVGDDLELTVADTGPGIVVDDLDQVFLPFFRSDTARASKVPGIGLGLGVVRAIVLAHGGTVDVQSAPGEGTTFRIRLPLGL